MAGNSVLTPSLITKEALFILHNSVEFIHTINKSIIDDIFGVENASNGFKAGSSVAIRVPARFNVSSGPTLQTQDFTERKIFATIPANNQKHVDISFTSYELALNMNRFSERYITPAMKRLASEVEQDVMQSTITLPGNFVLGSGVAGTDGVLVNGAATWADFLKAGAILGRNATPREDRRIIIPEALQTSVANSNLKNFNPQQIIADVYLSGWIGKGINADWFVSNLIPAYAQLPTGIAADTFTVSSVTVGDGSSVSQSSTTIVGAFAALTSGTVIKAGTIFTIAGVYMTNPETNQVYSTLQGFSLASDVTVGAAGAATLTLGYQLFGPGDTYQNVSRLPVAGDTIAGNFAVAGHGWVGSETRALEQAVSYHKDAFGVAFVD